MKIVFFSNFLNHHQLPLCIEFANQKDVEFIFVATEQIPKERLDMKYFDMNTAYDFVLRAYENADSELRAYELAENADVVIFGSAPIKYLETRMSTGKITFRFCERSLKKGYWRRFIPRTYKKIKTEYIRYNHLPLYVLGASAYASYDLKICGFNEQKCYKWGYFPEAKEYKDIDVIMKQKDKKTILWVARLIELKHPEFAINLAKRLKKENVSFTLKLIGDGVMKKKLESMIVKNQLEKVVSLEGALTAEQVRKEMEKSGIFLFTSDFREGWGAVVNEAMNSGCAVVVSHACGSAPFLLCQNENGIIYENENLEEAYQNVKMLLNDTVLQERLGRNAYLTILNKWNAKEAVERFLKLVDILTKEEICNLYQEGPCSLLELYENRWYVGKEDFMYE